MAMVSLAAGKVQARREAVNTQFDRLSHKMEARGEKLRAALANAQFNEKVSAASLQTSEPTPVTANNRPNILRA